MRESFSNNTTPQAAAPAVINNLSDLLATKIQITRERIEGLTYGIAIGDALGLPVETWTAKQIKEKFVRLSDFVSPSYNKYFTQSDSQLGTWSDDTQLTIAMLHALADAKEFSLETVINRHIEAYKQTTAGWGNSTKTGVNYLSEGIALSDPLFNKMQGTGNGIAMKIAPLAVLLAISESDNSTLVTQVKDICAISHRTSLAVSSGLAHTAGMLYCLSTSANDFSSDKFIEIVSQASELGRNIYPETLGAHDLTQRLRTLGDFKSKSSDEIVAAFGAGSCFVYDSLPFSYAFFLRNPLSFEATLDAVNAGGDTDSNAAIVAGLQGALLGKAFLPNELIGSLQGNVAIQAACDRFADSFEL